MLPIESYIIMTERDSVGFFIDTNNMNKVWKNHIVFLENLSIKSPCAALLCYELGNFIPIFVI